MNVLIFDTNIERVVKFTELAASLDSVVLFVTGDVSQAIGWLSANKFSQVFLDHGIENSGQELAKFLVFNPKDVEIIIHSEGATQITKLNSILQNHYQLRNIPFTRLFI